MSSIVICYQPSARRARTGKSRSTSNCKKWIGNSPNRPPSCITLKMWPGSGTRSTSCAPRISRLTRDTPGQPLYSLARVWRLPIRTQNIWQTRNKPHAHRTQSKTLRAVLFYANSCDETVSARTARSFHNFFIYISLYLTNEKERAVRAECHFVANLSLDFTARIERAVRAFQCVFLSFWLTLAHHPVRVIHSSVDLTPFTLSCILSLSLGALPSA